MWHLKTKSLILSFYFDVFYVWDKTGFEQVSTSSFLVWLNDAGTEIIKGLEFKTHFRLGLGQCAASLTFLTMELASNSSNGVEASDRS